MREAPDYVIRDVTDPWELRALEDVQVAAWGSPDRDVLPGTMLRISGATGGVVLGAYRAGDPAGEAVGLAYGFPALRGGEVWHHSHLLAVRPQERGSGLAVALKWAQRERVLAQGLTRMTWTFDPLVSRNARLNLGKLGVRSRTYLPDWYALGEDRARAVPADRLLVEWDLTRPHTPAPAPAPQGEFVLRAAQGNTGGEDGGDAEAGPGPLTWPSSEAPTLLAEVPTEFPPEGSGELRAWRLALREALSGAFERGYTLTDLAREGKRAYYVLRRLT